MFIHKLQTGFHYPWYIYPRIYIYIFLYLSIYLYLQYPQSNFPLNSLVQHKYEISKNSFARRGWDTDIDTHTHTRIYTQSLLPLPSLSSTNHTHTPPTVHLAKTQRIVQTKTRQTLRMSNASADADKFAKKLASFVCSHLPLRLSRLWKHVFCFANSCF